MNARLAISVAALCGACGSNVDGEPEGGAECGGPGARFATGVVEFAFGAGQDHGQDTFPAPVLGPPRGGGCCQGSLDVTSLGSGGFVVLEFGDNEIVDGPGPDFIVFENAFLVDEAAPESVFAELGTVSVSQDLSTWSAFGCDAEGYPYGGCAGWHPTLANAESNAIDPFDSATAGGDAFDLAEIGLEWARYVRIEDRTLPDDDMATFDLDAVAIVHARCP